MKAVDDVNFYINEGETFGLVGESGCGKTTLGRCILRAIEPTGGAARFKEEDGDIVEITALENQELRRVRKEMQMIFKIPIHP